MPKSAQASALLAATSLVVATTLGVWLMIWLVFIRPKVEFVNARVGVSPVAFHALSGLLPLDASPRTNAWRTLRLDSVPAIRAYVDLHADRPMILYLAAPAVGGRRDGPKARGGLEVEGEIWKGVVPFESNDELGLQKLLEACQNRKGKAKLLLVIDPGQVGTDASLGLFGSAVARQLRREAARPADPAEAAAWDDRWKNLGIFCACSPEQFSWPIEGLGQTAFDHALNLALAEPRKLRSLLDRVTSDVHRWVKDNVRNAVQVPMYLGDPSLNFFIPATKLPPPLLDDPTPTQRDVWERLQKEYERRDALAARRPYGFAPAAWRHYQERLLQAERLYRAGRFDDASDRLNLARRSEPQLVPTGDPSFGSLALGLRYAPDPATIDAFKKLDADLAAALASSPAPAPDAAAAEPPKEPKPSPILAPDRNPWARYAEGQLLDWLMAYRRLPVDESARLLNGLRAELFHTAVKLRRRSETISAAAVDANSPVRLAVETGDRRRRSAQDLLFLGRGDATTRADDDLKAADAQYSRAEEFLAAVELLNEVQSELPFLGAWYVRQLAREGRRGFDEPLKQIADRARALAAALDDPKTAGAEGTARLAQLRNDLAAVHATLRRDFATALEGSEKSTDWRLIDDLLLVPGIDAKARVALVEHARSFHRPPPPPEGKAGSKGVGGQLVKAAVNRNVLTQVRDTVNRALDAQDSAPPAAALRPPSNEPIRNEDDPAYRLVAAGMARLEWAVLAIGSGLPDADLQSLARDIDSIAEPGEEISTQARASFVAKLRDLRARLWDALQSPVDRSGRAGSRSIELAHAALPDHFARDDDASERARARYRDLLRWMARRMIEDFDPVRAREFLKAEDARGGDLADRVAALEKPTVIRVSPPIDSRLDLAALPQSLRIEPDPLVPEGRALLLVNAPDPKTRNALWLTRDDLPVDNGVEAPVLPSRPEAVQLVVNRRFQETAAGQATAASAVNVTLDTNLFYRGRTFSGLPWRLVLNPIKSQFLVDVVTDADKIKENKDSYRDQFLDHPGSAFVYPGWRHPCLFTLIYKTDEAGASPVEVEIEQGLKGAGPPALSQITLIPNVKKSIGNHELYFGPALPPKPGQRGANIREQDYVVKVWRKKNRARNDPPEIEKVFTFHELNPEIFNNIQFALIRVVDAPTPEYQVNVTVTRSRRDPTVNRMGVRVNPPPVFQPVHPSDAGKVDLHNRALARHDDAHTFHFHAPAELLAGKDLAPEDLDFVIVIADHYSITRRLSPQGGLRTPAPAPAPANPPP